MDTYEQLVAKPSLSDDEMSQLESLSEQKKKDLLSKPSLTDDEMSQLEGLHGSASQSPDEPPGPVETFAKKAADMPLMGYYPQAAAAAKSLVDKRPYVDIRDSEIKRLKEGEEANPIASMAGSATGLGASLLVPGSAATELAAPLGRSARAVLAGLEGLGMFMAQNPGDQPGVVDPIQAEDRIARVKENPKMALASTLIPMIGPGMQLAKEGDMAAESAYKASGPKAKDFKIAKTVSEESPRNAENIGRYALDNKIMTPMSTYEAVYKKASQKANDAGNEISNVIDKNKDVADNILLNLAGKKSPVADEFFKTSIDASKIDDIGKDIYKELAPQDGAESAIERVKKLLGQATQESGESAMRLPTLQKLRISLNNSINWGKDNSELPAVQQAFKMLKDRVDEAINGEFDMIEKVAGSSDKSKLQALRKAYGSSQTLADNALNKWASSETRSMQGVMPAAAAVGMGTQIATQSTPKALAAGALAGGAVLGSNLLSNGRMQTTIPNVIQSFTNPGGMVGTAPSRAMSMMSRSMGDQTLEGYNVNMLADALPEEVMSLKSRIENDPKLSNLEKGKRLYLLSKHNKIYLGQ